MTSENRAHDKDPTAFGFQPVTWQRPTDARPFRTCSYCGSIHPQDLLEMLQAGDTLELADLKHGWPHKFYTSEYNKFYSLHMIDAEEAFADLAALIAPAGVEFTQVPDGIAYRMPAKAKEL